MLRDSDKPEAEAGVEGIVFLTLGELTLTLDGGIHHLEAGDSMWFRPFCLACYAGGPGPFL